MFASADPTSFAPASRSELSGKFTLLRSCASETYARLASSRDKAKMDEVSAGIAACMSALLKCALECRVVEVARLTIRNIVIEKEDDGKQRFAIEDEARTELGIAAKHMLEDLNMWIEACRLLGKHTCADEGDAGFMAAEIDCHSFQDGMRLPDEDAGNLCIHSQSPGHHF